MLFAVTDILALESAVLPQLLSKMWQFLDAIIFGKARRNYRFTWKACFPLETWLMPFPDHTAGTLHWLT